MKILRTTIWILILHCLLFQAAAGQTFTPRRIFGQYQQIVWQDQHGLPQNGLSAVVQTPDGYLWLASAEGVVRFDGVRFTAFDTSNTPAIKSNNVQALLVDRTGVLWIGTHGGGLSRYEHGRFSHFGTQDGLSDSHIKCLLEDRAGNLWIGTDGGGLNMFRAGRFTSYTTAQSLPDNHIWTLAQDVKGALWIGTNGGLSQFHSGRFTNYKTGLTNESVRVLYIDRAGKLWAGTRGGLHQFQDGRFTNLGVNEKLKKTDVGSLLQDRDGTLWIGTIGSGLYRLKDGKFDNCTTREGLPSDEIQAIHQDAEGAIWLGTSGGGLVQLRAGLCNVYTMEDGLPHEMVGAVYADAEGNVWTGTEQGLSRFKDGKFTNYLKPDGQPFRHVTSISADQTGNVLIGSRGQIFRFQADRITNYNGLPSLAIMSFRNDRAGNFWVGTPYEGLHRFHTGQHNTYRQLDGLANDYVNALYEDHAGNLWIGTRQGLSCWQAGKITTWTAGQGFTGQHVLSFYEDATGTLWIGTHGDGLFRFKSEKFTVITTQNGLYDNLAFQILGDDNGNLWMSGNKGIYRASLQELNNFAEGYLPTVSSYAYGVADGMISRECNGADPAGAKTPDGKLWFPTIKGVVLVDPQKISRRAPLVTIEEVRLNGVLLPTSTPIEIRPGQENLEIQYTALSWNRPHALRFKYQVAGLEPKWIEAGTRRTAYFPHLPPGQYSFHVIADNGEGVWNEVGATINFVVLAPFYRTWWFLSLSILGVAGLAFGSYKLRVNQLEHANAAQQDFSRRLINAHEGERQRIAAELHDGLSQSLAIIRQRATICLQSQDDPIRQHEQMEEIAEAATTVIDEVREIIYDLRPVQLDRLGLTNSLGEMLDKVAQTHDLSLTRNLDQLDGRLPKEAENSLYRIVQEAVNNIVRHAHATRATVELKLTADVLRLVIADDGRGFIPDGTRNWVAGSGLGLTGIHERTLLLGGQLLVESAPQQGTTITIVLPLK